MTTAANNFYVKGIVGEPTAEPDGGEATARIGRMGDLVVSELQGRYYENTKRQNIFSLPGIATTTGIAALHINGAAAAAAGQYALVNPINSGNDLVLLRASVAVISGTVPAGPVWHAFFNAASVVVAKSNTIIGNYGNVGIGSVAVDFNNAASTALAATGKSVVVRQMPVNFSAGTFANLGGAAIASEEVAGDIIIPPGVGWTLQWSGAGTSVLNYYNATWAEIPV